VCFQSLRDLSAPAGGNDVAIAIKAGEKRYDDEH
jgi:hypothetical protein